MVVFIAYICDMKKRFKYTTSDVADAPKILFYKICRSHREVSEATPVRLTACLYCLGRIGSEIDLPMNPGKYEESWMKNSSIPHQIVEDLPEMREQFVKFSDFILSNRIHENEKFILCGFGNHASDDILLKRLYYFHGASAEFSKCFHDCTIDIKGALSTMIPFFPEMKELDLRYAASMFTTRTELGDLNDIQNRVRIMAEIYRSSLFQEPSLGMLEATNRRLRRNRWAVSAVNLTDK